MSTDNYEAMDAERLRFFIRLRDRQIATSTKFWITAAKEALAGKPQALRNRIELAEAGPVEVVLSDPDRLLPPA